MYPCTATTRLQHPPFTLGAALELANGLGFGCCLIETTRTTRSRNSAGYPTARDLWSKAGDTWRHLGTFTDRESLYTATRDHLISVGALT
jgi:hypothetical protein